MSGGAIEIPEVGPVLRRRMAGFVRTLRDNGFTLGLPEHRDALAILASPLGATPETLRPALRALLCATRGEWQRFDDIFRGYWQDRARQRTRITPRRRGATPLLTLAGHDAAAAEAPGSPAAADRDAGAEGAGDAAGRSEASAAERLAAADLRHLADPAELTQAHALAERLAQRMRARLVRREQARKRGRRIDLRRTIHRSIAHGGTPLDLVRRRRKHTPLRLVVLLDASGSMEPYTAFFLRFLHGVLVAFRQSEAFVFHTRLVHLSASLRDRDVARAVDRLSLIAQGMGGGTRIGESLAAFNRGHAKRVLNGRSAVLIFSDGYDTGEPALLAAEMQRLRRRCRRIVWLNPLLGWRRYAPEARGMQAALPHIDLFAPAHSLESLAALEPYLARI